jgi:carboxypeptidase C (cathepsin A)
MREGEAFAMGDYRRALAAGDSIPASTFERIAARMSRYSGLSETCVRTAKLRVSGEHFLAEFQRSPGKTEGVYDSRYQLFALDRAAEFPEQEATNATMDAPYVSLPNDHNGSRVLDAAPDLARAMTFNPGLRVFSANGYYDSVTPFLATQHLDLPPVLQAHITYGFYPAGHMIYLNTKALASLHDDLERWYSRMLQR